MRLSEIEIEEVFPYYDVCPECGYKFFLKPYETEDGQMFIRCESCDWNEYKPVYFWVGGWSLTVYRVLVMADILQLLLDQEVASFLRPRLKRARSHLASPPKPFPRWDDDYIWGEVEMASESYWGQMAVITAAYAESMMKDFLRCMFINQPHRMDRYLRSEGEKKAKIALNEILDWKEGLIVKLAERAVANARPARFDKILEELLKDAKIELDRPLVENLSSLRERRNQFGHQVTGEKVDAEQAYNWASDIDYLLYVLTGVAVRCGVPYEDDCGFLAARSN